MDGSPVNPDRTEITRPPAVGDEGADINTAESPAVDHGATDASTAEPPAAARRPATIIAAVAVITALTVLGLVNGIFHLFGGDALLPRIIGFTVPALVMLGVLAMAHGVWQGQPGYRFPVLTLFGLLGFFALGQALREPRPASVLLCVVPLAIIGLLLLPPSRAWFNRH